jgi:hypothetical protein
MAAALENAKTDIEKANKALPFEKLCLFWLYLVNVLWH